jgi:hypothetical protein
MPQTNAFLAQCRNQEKAAAKDSLQRAHLDIERLKRRIARAESRHAAEADDLRAQCAALKVPLLKKEPLCTCN